MTVLQSFPPEICSLICQDPTLERLDLNSICFISRPFRNEAQRELSHRFPCLRGANQVNAWCLSLRHKPLLAKKTKGLVLLLPRPSPFKFDKEDIARLEWALRKCKNLKELVVLFQGRYRRRREPYETLSSSFLCRHRFRLTKLVNGYFSHDSVFREFLRDQPNLESLELHSGKMNGTNRVYRLRHLNTLSCPARFLHVSYRVERLRLDFENSTDDDDEYEEIDVLGRLLKRNLNRNMKSLVMFFAQSQTQFPEIIRVIAASRIYIQHLEIHQFLPTESMKELPLPVNSYGRNIRTLVFRPPPALPENAGDNPNLCAYIELRTPIGRRKVAEKLIMRTLPTLTRLVLIVHGNDYEFRRNLFTGVITRENLITRDTREWTWVK